MNPLLIEPPVPITDSEPPFHYYDQHPTREDFTGSSAVQGHLVRYLVSLLEWHYRAEGWFIAADLNIYRRKQRNEYPVAPDVALFKGVVVNDVGQRTFRSWRLYEPDRPPPQVVFEICSDTTWDDDLNKKPAKYATLGVQEYYRYDPNEPPYLPAAGGRLRGWHLVGGVLVPQPLGSDGRLWSPALQAFLVPDGLYLRCYDQHDRRWLTQAEAERAAKEAERAAKEAAWAKLRELGIDPTTLD
ncbi:MAG: Uma2 family endonuclease [Chloroflexaceae bacterium]|jgi:Uma2 family endonuclease|nr:Uma2 family endonuclease [Chloroflexaceae bacterium]